MNDPNKRIDVNISSLLSLKAELLRKQEEVNRAKSKQTASTFVPKHFPKSKKEVPKSETEQGPKVVELEDNELLTRSRKVLEAKSKFYDRMTASGGGLNTEETCLVMFNKKQQDNKVPHKEESSEDSFSDNDSDYDSKNPNDDWVEYTDCLGRTRTCQKKDLDFFKRRDTSLATDLEVEKTQQTEQLKWFVDTSGVQNKVDRKEEGECDIDAGDSEEDDLLKTERKLEQMRQQWEKQEVDNKDKSFVHYQDILFNEARTHGVGYYQFSTDDEERARQQKELEKQREATLTSQKERDEQRRAREKIIAERVRAAKNRQRARQGLPPLEEDEDFVNTENNSEATDGEKVNSEKDLEEEILKEEERKNHVRPWDIGKTGTEKEEGESEWVYRGRKEPMSQEEWNEKQRAERISEFAPKTEPKKLKVPESSSRKSSPPPKNCFKYRNYTPEEPKYNSQDRKRGAEIPPPPSPPKFPKLDGLGSLTNSIEAGLKFLRNQSDKGQMGSKSTWSAKADY